MISYVLNDTPVSPNKANKDKTNTSEDVKCRSGANTNYRSKLHYPSKMLKLQRARQR